MYSSENKGAAKLIWLRLFSHMRNVCFLMARLMCLFKGCDEAIKETVDSYSLLMIIIVAIATLVEVSRHGNLLTIRPKQLTE